MEPEQAVTAVKLAVDLIEKVRNIYKEWTAKLPESEEKIEGEKTLQRAEEALNLAKVELAKGFGCYKLCGCTFPPSIMLSIGNNSSIDALERWRCPTCLKVSPPVFQDLVKVETEFNL